MPKKIKTFNQFLLRKEKLTDFFVNLDDLNTVKEIICLRGTYEGAKIFGRDTRKRGSVICVPSVDGKWECSLTCEGFEETSLNYLQFMEMLAAYLNCKPRYLKK